MRNIVYLLALLLVIVWAIGYFAYNTDGTIHLFLVLALVVVISKQMDDKELN